MAELCRGCLLNLTDLTNPDHLHLHNPKHCSFNCLRVEPGDNIGESHILFIHGESVLGLFDTQEECWLNGGVGSSNTIESGQGNREVYVHTGGSTTEYEGDVTASMEGSDDESSDFESN